MEVSILLSIPSFPTGLLSGWLLAGNEGTEKGMEATILVEVYIRAATQIHSSTPCSQPESFIG